MVLRILTNLESRLHKNAYVNPKSFSVYRIIFSLYILTFASFNFSWIAEFPDIFFHPPYLSIANLFEGFPPPFFFNTINFLLPALFICILFGFQTRIASILASILLILVFSFQYSFGKIDHYILLVITPFLLSLSNWGDKYSIDSYFQNSKSINNKRNYGLSLLALCICVGFFTAGFPKYLNWMDFDLETYGVRLWLHRSYYINGNQEYLSGFIINLKNKFFWEFIDYTVVIFEVTFIVACFTTRRIFRIYLCLAAIFHLINYLILNNPFSSYIIVYAAFIDWFTYTEKLKKYLKIKRNIKRYLIISLFIIILLLYIVLYFLGIKFKGIKNIFFPAFKHHMLIFTISTPIAVYYLLTGPYKYLKKKLNKKNV